MYYQSSCCMKLMACAAVPGQLKYKCWIIPQQMIAKLFNNVLRTKSGLECGRKKVLS